MRRGDAKKSGRAATESKHAENDVQPCAGGEDEGGEEENNLDLRILSLTAFAVEAEMLQVRRVCSALLCSLSPPSLFSVPFLSPSLFSLSPPLPSLLSLSLSLTHSHTAHLSYLV